MEEVRGKEHGNKSHFGPQTFTIVNNNCILYLKKSKSINPSYRYPRPLMEKRKEMKEWRDKEREENTTGLSIYLFL